MTFQERWDYQKMMYQSCWPHQCPRCGLAPKHEPRHICRKCGFNLLTGATESFWTRWLKPILSKILKIVLVCGAAWLFLIIMSYVINHQDTFYLFIGFIIGVGVSSLAWVRYFNKK